MYKRTVLGYSTNKLRDCSEIRYKVVSKYVHKKELLRWLIFMLEYSRKSERVEKSILLGERTDAYRKGSMRVLNVSLGGGDGIHDHLAQFHPRGLRTKTLL